MLDAIELADRMMRKAGIVIPSSRNNQSPPSANPVSTRAANRQARNAMRRRTWCEYPWVIDRKIGASPMGSTTTNRVTKCEIRESTGTVECPRLPDECECMAEHCDRPADRIARRRIMCARSWHAFAATSTRAG